MATAPDGHEVWKVRCPTCKVRPHAQCVYTQDRDAVRDYRGNLIRPARTAGQITQRPHTERYTYAWKVQERKRRTAYHARMAFDPAHDVRAANAEFLRREHEELRVWLRRYAWILWK